MKVLCINKRAWKNNKGKYRSNIHPRYGDECEVKDIILFNNKHYYLLLGYKGYYNVSSFHIMVEERERVIIKMRKHHKPQLHNKKADIRKRIAYQYEDFDTYMEHEEENGYINFGYRSYTTYTDVKYDDFTHLIKQKPIETILSF